MGGGNNGVKYIAIFPHNCGWYTSNIYRTLRNKTKMIKHADQTLTKQKQP